MLENLHRAQCVGPDAGPGAIIISPTRELAIQIFEVLCKIGKYGHLFAAGLVIGGKSLAEEAQALVRMNIVVCTPGRILQHLSQTAGFALDTLRMLVLDEADRILDMGFSRELDAIIEYLPPPSTRQTLLFSATQTKKISDLARLSLHNPTYISVHESLSSSTPETLQQNYTLTPLPTKLDTLWSFLQSAKKSKTIAFLSSGKQVRFLYESLRKLQPGVPLLHLHGRQRQTARLDITRRFSAAKHACLLSTDIAARGLDFPAVDWVVQVDCPEDADTYIHRVGRTARYQRAGRAVLFLDPVEEPGFLARLAEKKVPLERINVRGKKQRSVKQQLAGLCFGSPELKYLGQKAFASYVRSVRVMRDKEVFPVEKYDWAGFAESLGLPGQPRIRFTEGDVEERKRLKNAPRQGRDVPEEEEDSRNGEKKAKTKTKYDRMFGRVNQDVLAPHYAAMVDDGDSAPSRSTSEEKHDPTRVTDDSRTLGDADEKDDNLFTTRTHYIPKTENDAPHSNPDESQPSSPPTTTAANPEANSETFKPDPLSSSRRRQRLLSSRKQRAKLSGERPTRLVFDEETGEARAPQVFEMDEERRLGGGVGLEEEEERRRREFVAREREWMRSVDEGDREAQREKVRVKRERKRRRERDVRGMDGDAGMGLEMEVVERPFEGLDGGEDDDGSIAEDGEGKERHGRETKKWKGDDDTGSGDGDGMEAETVEDLEGLALRALAS